MGKDGRLAMLLALATISLLLSSADSAGAGAGRPRPGRRGPCCTFVAQSTPLFTKTTKRAGALNTAGPVGSLPRFSIEPTIRARGLQVSGVKLRMSAANEAEEGSKEKKGGVGGGYKFDVDMGGEAAPDAEAGDFFFTPDGSYPMDYFGESTRGDLLPHKDFMDAASILKPHDVKQIGKDLGLDRWGTPTTWGLPAEPQRAIFCSRTLNLRAINCVGYDMDYTLIHYKVVAWEGRAYYYAKKNLQQVGFPVEDLVFDPELVCRGTIIDRKLGNIVKVDRFGYVKRAMHGTRRLSHRETHEVYGRQLVDLRDGKRWLFLNTLFSVSEGCLYAQLVEKLDQGNLEVVDSKTGSAVDLNYDQLFNAVSKSLFKAHVEGRLKADVMTDPEAYVEFDADLPKVLLDQREAGKKLALITNSDWEYTKVMMHHVFDRFLPDKMTWRDLFNVIIVSARKPAFFSQKMPLYEIVTEDGMMREKYKMKEGRIYSGGSASMVETLFNVNADEVMYVGDHIFTDVNIAKEYMRWRTALIVKEFEEEVLAIDRGKQHTEEVRDLIKAKERCSNIFNHMRTELHRYQQRRPSTLFTPETEQKNYRIMAKLLATMIDYDNKIAPMLYNDGSHFNKYWGYISRGGFNDQSHLMRQIEKYADVYTSRVSNFLRYTPYMYFRNSRQALAHHRNLDKYREEVPKEVLDDLSEYSIRREEELESESWRELYGGDMPIFSAETAASVEPGQGLGKGPASEAGSGGASNHHDQDDDLRKEEINVNSADEFGHEIMRSGILELDGDDVNPQPR